MGGLHITVMPKAHSFSRFLGLHTFLGRSDLKSASLVSVEKADLVSAHCVSSSAAEFIYSKRALTEINEEEG